jgi:molybdopterin/thiamine biosynthesis adenylyltransferase
METLTETVEAQFGRVKGAEWFPFLYQKDVLVLGQGGIGSWLSLMLSRIGCNLFIYDMDHYEEHNMTGQFVGSSMVGQPKVDAVASHIQEFSPACVVNAIYERYTTDSVANNITLCGFDNMVARKIAWQRWREQFADDKEAIFMDGRLTAEHLQIFSIQGGDKGKLQREEYEKHLFNDSEVAEEECTFKQTSHCAAMIASHMTGILTNWASNQVTGTPMRPVPFLFEFSVPLNMIL